MKKLFMLLCVFGVLSARLFAAETAPGRVLLKADFDNDTSAGLARALIAHRHVELARGAGPDGSDAIRVAYVGGTMGSERIVVGYPLGAEVDQATLSFDVRFDKDFQWVGGGKVHTPKPRDYSQSMPRKMRRAALRSALSVKAAEQGIVVVDVLALPEPKTRLMAKALDSLVGQDSALILIPEKTEGYELVTRSANNLPDAKTIMASYLNIRDLMKYDRLVLPLPALDVLVSILG